MERGEGLQPGGTRGKAVRQERTWTDVHVHILKKITSSPWKGVCILSSLQWELGNLKQDMIYMF